MSDIEAGDIVTGYHTGYWKVIKSFQNQIEYQRIDVVSKKPVIKSCHVNYCTKIDPDALRIEMIAEADRIYDLIKRATN